MLIIKFFSLKLTLEKKGLLSCSYNSHKNSICNQLQTISKTLNTSVYICVQLCKSYDNIILLGDFNVDSDEAKMSELLKSTV